VTLHISYWYQFPCEIANIVLQAMDFQNDTKGKKREIFTHNPKLEHDNDGSHRLSSSIVLTASTHHTDKSYQVIKTNHRDAVANRGQRRKLRRLAEQERKVKFIQSKIQLIPFERYCKPMICKRNSKKAKIGLLKKDKVTTVSNSCSNHNEDLCLLLISMLSVGESTG
jgi:hypothetical protein